MNILLTKQWNKSSRISLKHWQILKNQRNSSIYSSTPTILIKKKKSMFVWLLMRCILIQSWWLMKKAKYQECFQKLSCQEKSSILLQNVQKISKFAIFCIKWVLLRQPSVLFYFLCFVLIIKLIIIHNYLTYSYIQKGIQGMFFYPQPRD